MANSKFGRAVLVDGKVYERQTDGTLIPITDQTDYARLDAMSEEEVEEVARKDLDGPPLTDNEWMRAAVRQPLKVPVGLKLDDDVLDWFKSQGRGYQTRINAILRRYVEAHRKAG
ncbi:MAG: hypothetical protein JWM36_1549 [Hyphomicrobiales bacterium]|nr:hypothetical protein [Hyphomicrobiales bacterium]